MSVLNKTVWVIVFSVAMGFLETAVVVYLRALYYPQGFQFPLVVLDPNVGVVEILREAATVVMLVGVAVLAGSNARQRIAFFLIAFAVWDLFYYVFLKLFLDWPSSFFTWDILFLIPAPWVGPVLSPVIVCCTMLTLSTVLLRNEKLGIVEDLRWRNWLLILSGSVVLIISWMWDYVAFSGHLSDTPGRALETLSTYIPVQFNWAVFGIGEVLILLGIFLYGRSSWR